MRKPVQRFTLATLLLSTHLVTAHEQALHKGRPTEGEIASVAGDQVTLKTATGTLTVILTDSTTFERAQKPAARTDLREGVRLSVFGTKLATGELVAREVLVSVPDPNVPEGHPGHAAHDAEDSHARPVGSEGLPADH